MEKIEVYHKESGHMGQYEEWWHLIKHDNGNHEVENSWHNVKVNGLTVDKGSKIYSLEDGMREAPSTAEDKIKQILGL